MRPPNNSPRHTAALSVTGLVLGAVLGYSLISAPPPSAAVSVSPTQNAAAASPKTPDAGPKKSTAPFHPAPAMAGGSLALAEFEAWLATASCDEVMREILDPAVNAYPGSAPVNALLVRRFREFSVEERFTSLQRHLTDGKKIQHYEVLPILSDLAKATLPRRAEEILGLFKKGNQLDDYGIAAALQEWAAADLPAALAFAGKLEGFQAGRIPGYVIASLGDTNMELARQEALKLPSGEAREAAMEGLAWRMVGKGDPTAVLDWLRRNGMSSRNETISALQTVASKDGASAAQLILDQAGIFEGENGPQYVSEVFQTWSKRDPAAAAAWLEAHPLPERHRNAAEKALMETRWKSLPLEDALTEYRNLPADAKPNNGRELADRLLAEDPEHAAERLAASLPQEEQAGIVVSNFLSSLPTEYLPQALHQFPDLMRNLERSSLVSRLSMLPESTLESLLPQLPEKARSIVQGLALDMASTMNPERAMAMIETMDPAKISRFAFSGIASVLSQSDPQKAADWIQGIEEGSNREWAAVNLVANWAKYDPDAATAWLQTLPPGLTRDHATVEAASMRALTGDHQSALTLAAGIADPVNRNEATGRALQQYWKQNPDAAATALSNSGLTTAQQTTVAEKLGKGEYRN